MSRRQEPQSADGILTFMPAYGILSLVRSSAPSGGERGYAPGCQWTVPTSATGVGVSYTNIGGNGVGSNSTATWIPSDPSSSGRGQFGLGLVTGAFLRSSGNIYADVQAAAGISPSATGADKILAAVWLPASVLDAAGRGIQVTVFGTAAANGNNKLWKVVLGATNSTYPDLPLVDGTVTLTGGTTIGTTGTLTTNNGGILLQCQLFKRGAVGSNTQASMTTSITGGGTHGGVGVWTNQTFTESSNLLLAVIGNATTTATDVVYNGCEVTAFN